MNADSTRLTLVTGATGLVGNNLVRQLLQLGRRVRVLVRDPHKESLRGLNVEVAVGDILQPSSLQAAMAGVASVFHVAGWVSIEGQDDAQMRRVNVAGTGHVVDACLENGQKSGIPITITSR